MSLMYLFRLIFIQIYFFSILFNFLFLQISPYLFLPIQSYKNYKFNYFNYSWFKFIYICLYFWKCDFFI